MEFADQVNITRVIVILGAIYAALNWRTFGYEAKLITKIIGAVFVWTIPMTVFDLDGWFQLSWMMLGMGIGATVATRSDGAPWVNWGNAFFIVASSLTLILGIMEV